MDARFLDVLHDCADHARLAIGDAIDIDLDCVLEKTIDEHRPIRRYFNRARHVTSKIFVVVDELHRASAENEGWPNEHRIANFLRYRDGASVSVTAVPFGVWRKPSLSSIAAKSFRSSAVSMLSGCVPRIGTPAALQSIGEIQRRLAAELHDHAFRLFLIVNVEHVLERERLEIKFVARVVIGRNRFRIRVHHDRFEPELAQGERGVHAAVIKFDALADPVRSATENHDLALCRSRAHLVLVAVSRIVVRRVRFELRRAGIHQAIGRYDSRGFSFAREFRLL